MSRFTENLGVIPRAAKLTAWIVSVGLAALILYLGIYPPPGSQPLPPAGVVFLPILAFAFPFAIIMFVGYVHGDAKRRGMRYVMWTMLAIFVPYMIGIILYFSLRDPLPSTCPKCSASVLSQLTFCPNCGTTVKPACPQCGKRVETGWSNCGHCGTKLPDIPQRAA